MSTQSNYIYTYLQAFGIQEVLPHTFRLSSDLQVIQGYAVEWEQAQGDVYTVRT